MARRYFGTDGVRGVVGEDPTLDLVERIGKAATLWAGASRVLVGRDTRASGPALEERLVRGIVSAGGSAILAGVLPTPAVALLAEDLGAVISASHNPPEYNGVKLFDGEGRKLVDEDEEAIEALLDAPSVNGGSVEHVAGARERYLAHVLEGFGSDLAGLRIGVDSANGAFSDIAPAAFEQLGAEVHAIGSEPTGRTSTSAVARPTSAPCRRSSGRRGSTSASRSTATATGCSRWTSAESRSTETRSSRSSRSPSASTSSP